MFFVICLTVANNYFTTLLHACIAQSSYFMYDIVYDIVYDCMIHIMIPHTHMYTSYTRVGSYMCVHVCGISVMHG